LRRTSYHSLLAVIIVYTLLLLLLFLFFFFSIIPPPPSSTLFPYTTLFRSWRPSRNRLRRATITHASARVWALAAPRLASLLEAVDRGGRVALRRRARAQHPRAAIGGLAQRPARSVARSREVHAAVGPRQVGAVDAGLGQVE